MFLSWLSKVIFLITVFLVCTILYFKKSFLYWKTKGIPFVSPSIPFGNVGELVLGKKCIGAKIADIYQELKKQGVEYGGYYFLTKPVFMPLHTDLIRDIFVKDFSHFEERGIYYDEKIDPLSAHLFSIRNPKWYELRTKFSPMYTSAKLREMMPILLNFSDDLKNVLDVPSQTGERVDIKETMARFTTDIISSCAFGVESHSLQNPNAELRKVGREFMKGSFRNSIVLSLANVAPPILKFFKIPLCSSHIGKYFMDVITDTVERREKYNIERNDMMNLLIKLKNNKRKDDNKNEDMKSNENSISFNDLAAQSFIFFLTGYETSSTTMTFAIFELSKHKDIQDKLRDEIINTLKKHNDEITYDALNEMPYLDKVVQETLRKYPVLPFLNRECTKNYTIPKTDKIIEKGTPIVVSVLGIQRDPELYKNPEVFDPERFSQERKNLIKPNTYIPFGLGPRNCIGLRFGIMQAKFGLAVLLKNYKFILYPETEFIQKMNSKSFLLAFKETIWLQVSRI